MLSLRLNHTPASNGLPSVRPAGCCARLRVAALLGVVPLAFSGACSKSAVTVDEAGGASARPVRIDRSENGAASRRLPNAAPAAAPRVLLFETTGVTAPAEAGGSRAAAVAARQAAVLEALRSAILAWRADGGEHGHNFGIDLGPRLHVRHRAVDGGYEFVAELRIGDATRVVRLRNGALAHAPCDAVTIDRIFAETGGLFARLPASPSDPPGMMVARVGCYRILDAAARPEAPRGEPLLAGASREGDADAP